MQQYLYKFLVLHRKLTIPQLGSFTIDKEPARFDVSSGLLFAPKPVIHFGETIQPMSDKFFFSFLADEMGVEEVTAIREFHDFSYQFRNDIKEHRQGLLAGVGRITKGSDEALSFTQESTLLDLLPPIQLQDALRNPGDRARMPSKKSPKQSRIEPVEQIVSETEEDSEEVIVTTYKERWWIPAIILLVAGLVALLFYYQ